MGGQAIHKESRRWKKSAIHEKQSMAVGKVAHRLLARRARAEGARVQVYPRTVTQEECVSRNASQDEVEEILKNPKFIEAAHKKMP